MDMIKNDKTTAVEDRLSSLPDDIIHHILGFLDLKYAVQTSALSWKWKNLWTFMPRLNLSSHMFDGMKQFSKFVEHALSHRDSCAEVSAVDLTFSASPTHFIIQDIVNYAYSCNVRQMTLEWSGGVGHELPEFFFSSHTLKYLTLDQGFCSSARSRLPKIDWDFPALETLNLTNIRLGDVNTKSLDLFSKCLHLKDLTLDNCSMYGLEVFNVSAPQLSNLIITKTTAFPTVFNVASTQLENLTASIISNGGMASCFRFLRLSAEGFVSLEKVNISLSNGSRCRKEIAVPPLLDLFQVLRNAKLVILDVNIIEVFRYVTFVAILLLVF
uniref:F-box/FBD/LRR-repeat protein At5g56420-like n=1 Tax=Erigeron canadensis TaxID=72917 RepID=UPI001CB96C80|nr:F-box/FBD/LRR-repeat protein At5g56420-like [Erigeron canadensis]